MRLVWFGLIGLFLPMATLAQDPEILVNPQGLAQKDLSIRGSSYAGTGISLNGLNMKVPYSAHFNAGLPIPEYLLSEPVSRIGLANASGFLNGTAIRRTVPQPERFQSTLGVGSEEHYYADSSAFNSGIGGYLDWIKARHVDHNANDLDRYSGSAYLQHFNNDWQYDLIIGYEKKDYGAQGYYGIPSNVYANEQTRDALVFLGATHGELDGAYLRASAVFRAFYDEYRIPNAAFKNDAGSRLGSVAIEGRTLEIQNIALNLRGDLEHERVHGDIGAHDRTRGSILMLPEARFARFTVKAGLNTVFQTAESAEWLPQAGIDFFATDNIKLYVSYSENVQQPDYQTLYYSDPYHLGDSDLRQQSSQNTEVGFHQFVSAQLDWRAAVFYRRKESASDWLKPTATDTAWTATDLGTLDVYGVDAKVNFLASDTLKLELYYQWLTKDDYPYFAGLYELDYPEHLLGFSGRWQISSEFLLFATQTLRYQTENNARTSNDFGADASLGLHYTPRFAKNVRLSFLVENLWGTNFQAVPGLKSRPASFSTGISVNW